MSIHPEYIRIFDALTARDIRYCMLRDELQAGGLLDDLDLLVDERRFRDAIDVFSELGYHVKKTHRALPYKSVLVAFQDGAFIVIDLHCKVVQNEIVMLDDERVLQNRILRNGYYLPGKADLIAILVLHNILEKNRIQKKHAPIIRDLVEQIDSEELKSRLKVLCSAEIASVVLTILRDLEAYQKPSDRLSAVSRQLNEYYERSDSTLKWRRFRRRGYLFRKRWSLLTRAPIYALTGVDGVGKSSLNDALLDILNQPGGFRAVTEYMGPWGHHHLRWMTGELFTPGWSLTTGQWLSGILATGKVPEIGLRVSTIIIAKMILGRTLTETEKCQHDLIRSHSRVFLTLRYFRSIYAASRFMVMITVEMYYRYYVVWRHRRRGTTVIADRYIYDLMTGRMHDYIPNYRRVRSFLCWIFPRPTKVFLLYNDPEAILRRKDDLTNDTLRQFMKIYAEQAERRGFERLKTDRPPDILAKELIAGRIREIAAKAKI